MLNKMLVDAQKSGSGASSCEVSIQDLEEMRHFLASAEPLQIGVVDGWALTLTDLTDRVRAEQSLASERAARAIISSANEAVVVCDAAGNITHANAAVGAIAPGDLLGRPFHEAVRLEMVNATGLVQAEELIQMAISGMPTQGVEAHAPDAPRTKDILFSVAPLSPSPQIVSGCVITMVDLSQRKAAEQRQRLLMAELDHRVKNTLALVTSILRRTDEADIEKFKETFSGRIQALAATHNLLATKAWATISIEEVFQAEVAPYAGSGSGRIQFLGERIELRPRAAVAVGLILHELASNAAKYGALSTDAGHVCLSVAPGGGGGCRTVEWIETNGPRVQSPTRRGFGRSVIQHSLRYSPHGGAEVEFLEAGVRCRLQIPAEDVLEGA